jgi:hypothetical protein
MHTRIKLLFAAVTAALLMSLAVGSAAANRLSVSNRLIRVTWARLEVRSGAKILECPLTLEGSFHSQTIRKVRGALIGAVTRGIPKSESCTGGGLTILQEQLPWHLTYEAFTGTLPTITAITLLVGRIAFQIAHFTLLCLYKTVGEDNPAVDLAVGTNGQITTIRPVAARTIRLMSGTEMCFPTVELEGAGDVFQLGTATRISVRLI